MMKMEKHSLICLFLVFSFTMQYLATTHGRGFDLSDYFQVRQKVFLSWWYYESPYKVDNSSSPWPTILWLQGGPGGSGSGYGNFIEIGPFDGKNQSREYTWLRKANLLFVDSPAGAGFSYVEDESLLAKKDKEAATELITLLKYLVNKLEGLQESPLYIFGESYGGKIAVTLGLEILEAFKANELTIKLGGVALGNSWISPQDFVFSWGPLLKDMSRLDNNGLKESDNMAQIIKQRLENHEYEEATILFLALQQVIKSYSNHVDFYNLLEDHGAISLNVDIAAFMNGPVRERLKIIPENVTWELQSQKIIDAFTEEFMKPRIDEVDKLLAEGVSVAVYNGQLDLICSTKGAEAWVEKLRWDGLTSFLSLPRDPLYCENDRIITRGFRRKYGNFAFYWILRAGHNVPLYQPCIGMEMAGEITNSPSLS